MGTRPERTHFTLFVPGSPRSAAAWGLAVEPTGLTLHDGLLGGPKLPFSARSEWVENPRDGSFGKAFSFGTASEPEQRTVEAAPGALVLSVPVDLHRARAGVVEMVRALAAAGALAVRVEESKLGFMVAQWIERVDGADPWALYRAVVVMLKGRGRATTRGMRAFSLPDAEVALDADTDEPAASALLEGLNVYQMTEDPLLLSGHTFSLDPQSPKRPLYRWPDDVYAAGHACHNPFGVWRVGAAGSPGRPTAQLAFSALPELVVTLGAIEERQGKPLTRAQVEKIVSEAPGIAMKHLDARELERRRGHADIDPGLAWEQWQVARRRQS